MDESKLLFFCPRTADSAEERPELLQQIVLHHFHTSLEGGHQRVGRTYLKIRSNFHWRGLYWIVQRYVGECVHCVTGKGLSTIRGETP